MSDPPDAEDQETVLRRSLLRYVEEHPQAMDTAEGISAWWMKDQKYSDVETVRRILEQMTSEGLLEKLGSGRYSHYRPVRARRPH